ncbi:MAG TPA: hypothetical protein VLB84_20315, partial [Bacteroidia bacterium]|nr:hypothetical protein [Bacteroidia bacterium]
MSQAKNTSAAVKIANYTPILNQKLEDAPLEFLRRFIDVEEVEEGHTCAPKNLKMVQDIFKIFCKREQKG